jgi:sulfopyruvate decarboxylase subunit alpha
VLKASGAKQLLARMAVTIVASIRRWQHRGRSAGAADAAAFGFSAHRRSLHRRQNRAGSSDPATGVMFNPAMLGRCPDAEGSMSDAAAALSPETVLAEIKKQAITHVVWLPDSETNWLYLLMHAEPSLRLVGVSREGHACSIAAGLAAGGAKPLILIQNTGMMEAGDSLRGWLLGLNVPVVLMVGYRGWTRHGVNTDTAATYTERFLMAFGLNYYLVESDADASRIGIAFEEAARTRRPVVVLVGDEYHGFNR